ncbi:MAG: cation transporter [Nitratireductor sp.]|nr:cation transporter [Nitratireductor sp.]
MDEIGVRREAVAARVRLLAKLSVLVALVLMAVKFVAWRLTGSVALYSDALESIVNVIASLVALYAVRVSQRPADDTHPFGHQKAEYFAAVFEGMMITAAALLIVNEAWHALSTPRALEEPWTGMAVNAGAAIGNGLWAALLLRTAREARSPALDSDARHILSDVVTSVGVLLGLAAAAVTGWTLLDPLLALAVAVNILREGWKIISNSIHALMDHALPVTDQETICRVIAGAAGGALEFHDLKTREAGSARFAEFHLVVPAAMTVRTSHAICDRIEQALRAAMPGIKVVIHVEPEDKRKPGQGVAL